MDNPTKFEVYGQEMLEKIVKKCGNSGRIYLPPNWIEKKVKIIRVD
jgi:putative transposon-encoded protein